jgi:hypothetical protein
MRDPYAPLMPAADPPFLVGLVYGVLAVLGVLLGLLGSFEFSWTAGGVPIAAILLVLVNLAAFRAAGWATESKLGAVVPAALWMVILLVLSAKRPEGDLVVTATMPGYVYMFGGAAAALAAIVRTRGSSPLSGMPGSGPGVAHGQAPAVDRQLP